MPDAFDPYITLDKIRAYISIRYKHFGINKQRETVRLCFEICKRDNIDPNSLFLKLDRKDFDKTKKTLLAIRYPSSSSADLSPYLPDISISKQYSVKNVKKYRFSPGNFYVEKAVNDSVLLKRFKRAFPAAKVSEISSMKEHLSDRKNATSSGYNNRDKSVYFVKEKYDFIKKCPCTGSAIGCGYNVFNHAFGCIFDCTYCYLQEYTNSPGIILPCNMEDYLLNLKRQANKKLRIGSGEFSDSLMLDHITLFSGEIISFFNKHAKNMLFEFKTKSDNIGYLLKNRHVGNIVVSWSVNPDEIVKDNEYRTAPIKDRIETMKKTIQAGYKIGLHFDPVFYYKGWESGYSALIETLVPFILSKNLAWVSLGTLRFKPETKKVIENRFPQNKILDEELVLGFDGKLRYPDILRYKIYKFMLGTLFKIKPGLPVYLCMENKSMWQALQLPPPFLG